MEHHPHHMHHNPPLPWGYSNATAHTAHNTWVPPPSRGLKRSISESDCEDAYSETSSKETSAKDGETDSCQHLSRKKRRGVIEKKRRDRINSSLSELKRLVPSALEKQGSAKLEKAEILQLTVDHLKTINAKGVDTLSYDPQRFAMDYHIIGFRECAAEVARYLVNHENMDIQDPLRMRLMSHLQCFVAQREISAKSQIPTASPGWSAHPSPYHSLPHHQSSYATSSHVYPQHAYGTTQINGTNSGYTGYIPNLSTAINTPPAAPAHEDSSTTAGSSAGAHSTGPILSDQQQVHQHHQQQQHFSGQHETSHQEQNNGPTYTDISSSVHRNTSASIGYGNPHYPLGGAQGYANIGAGSSASAFNNNNNNKPYRPWGSGPEIAY